MKDNKAKLWVGLIRVRAWKKNCLVSLFSYYLMFYWTGYNVSYEDDKRYGESSYTVSSEMEQIQKEIMTNGPVEGAFTVYSDFPSYKSGEHFQLCWDNAFLHSFS